MVLLAVAVGASLAVIMLARSAAFFFEWGVVYEVSEKFLAEFFVVTREENERVPSLVDPFGGRQRGLGSGALVEEFFRILENFFCILSLNAELFD